MTLDTVRSDTVLATVLTTKMDLVLAISGTASAFVAVKIGADHTDAAEFVLGNFKPKPAICDFSMRGAERADRFGGQRPALCRLLGLAIFFVIGRRG